MKDKYLKAEIWEVQVILYWILALFLFQFGHSVLGWVVLVWSIISFVGVFVLLVTVKVEEILAKKLREEGDLDEF